MMRALLVALGLALLSGCYTIRYYSPSHSQVGVTRTIWTHSILWGLVPVGQVNLDEVCGPSGVSEIESKFTIATWAVMTITQGLWTPMKVKVTCAAGG